MYMSFCFRFNEQSVLNFGLSYFFFHQDDTETNEKFLLEQKKKEKEIVQNLTALETGNDKCLCIGCYMNQLVIV